MDADRGIGLYPLCSRQHPVPNTHNVFSVSFRLGQTYVGSLIRLSMKCVFAGCSSEPSILTHATTMERITQWVKAFSFTLVMVASCFCSYRLTRPKLISRMMWNTKVYFNSGDGDSGISREVPPNFPLRRNASGYMYTSQNNPPAVGLHITATTHQHDLRLQIPFLLPHTVQLQIKSMSVIHSPITTWFTEYKYKHL